MTTFQTIGLRRAARSIFVMSMFLNLAWGQSGDVSEGRRLYEARCQGCHQANGEPVEAMERVFDVDMRDLSSEEVQAKGSEELEEDIVRGTGRMRPVSGLDGDAVQSLLDFLRSLAEEETSSPEAP